MPSSTQAAVQGRNGITGLRRYMDDRGDGYVPPASGLEGRARKVLADAGIPMRVEVDLGDGDWVGRVDMMHEELPVVLEIQSERYHSALCSQRDDDGRVRRLEGIGFIVAAVWDRQVWHTPWELVTAVEAAIRQARARSVFRR